MIYFRIVLEIRKPAGETFTEHGWAVIGEKPGDASTEVLADVLPLDRRGEAQDLAAAFQANKRDGLSWLSTSVSLARVRPVEDGQVGVYVEASNLTHPASKAA